jgi:hypothetical protein
MGGTSRETTRQQRERAVGLPTYLSLECNEDRRDNGTLQNRSQRQRRALEENLILASDSLWQKSCIKFKFPLHIVYS